MQYFQELDLPKIFVDNSASEIIYEIKRNKKTRSYVCLLTEFLDLVNPELLNYFKQVNLKPYALMAFGHENDYTYKRDLYVHTDVIKDNNEWVKVPFAINWEITDTEAEFKWYDTTGYGEFYPPDILNTHDYLLGNGIHYGRRYVPGTPNITYPFPVITTYTFKPYCAVMVRTSEPHAVVYERFNSRLSVSLRFKNLTWDHALKIFKAK